MGLIEIILVGVLSLLLLAETTLIFLPYRQSAPPIQVDVPMVSVLVSVRNEENHIHKTIESLSEQSYGRYEILIADDSSTDNTYEVLQKYAATSDRLRVFKNKEVTDGQNGKAVALAFLATQAQGDILAFADGDAIYPPGWIETMVKKGSGVGIVSAPVGVTGNWLQDLDWKLYYGRMVLANEAGFKSSALGINMVVSKEAYLTAGGFEKALYSVVEDFELNKNIVGSGYMPGMLFEKDVLAVTQSENFSGLLQQRKRWLQGIKKLGITLRSLLYARALLLPSIIFFLSIWSIRGVCIYVAFIFAELVLHFRLLRILEHKTHLLRLLAFGFYQQTLTIILLIYDLMVADVSWKGRKFN